MSTRCLDTTTGENVRRSTWERSDVQRFSEEDVARDKVTEIRQWTTGFRHKMGRVSESIFAKLVREGHTAKLQFLRSLALVSSSLLQRPRE